MYIEEDEEDIVRFSTRHIGEVYISENNKGFIMGIGVARKVKIVVVGQSMGVDGVDVTSEEVANLWAQINTVSQNRGFDGGKANFKTSYEFLIRYDQNVEISIRCMIEYSNRFYSIQSIDRVDRVRGENKFASQLQNNPEGKYWRIVATSQDIA